MSQSHRSGDDLSWLHSLNGTVGSPGTFGAVSVADESHHVRLGVGIRRINKAYDTWALQMGLHGRNDS